MIMIINEIIIIIITVGYWHYWHYRTDIRLVTDKTTLMWRKMRRILHENSNNQT